MKKILLILLGFIMVTACDGGGSSSGGTSSILFKDGKYEVRYYKNSTDYKNGIETTNIEENLEEDGYACTNIVEKKVLYVNKSENKAIFVSQAKSSGCIPAYVKSADLDIDTFEINTIWNIISENNVSGTDTEFIMEDKNGEITAFKYISTDVIDYTLDPAMGFTEHDKYYSAFETFSEKIEKNKYKLSALYHVPLINALQADIECNFDIIDSNDVAFYTMTSIDATMVETGITDLKITQKSFEVYYVKNNDRLDVYVDGVKKASPALTDLEHWDDSSKIFITARFDCKDKSKPMSYAGSNEELYVE